MKKSEIEKVRKLNVEIDNFVDCYSDSKLTADRDGNITPETLIAWMIENPHFQEIANNISKLNR